MPQTWQDFSSMLFLSSSRGPKSLLISWISQLLLSARFLESQTVHVPFKSQPRGGKSQPRMAGGFDTGLLLEFCLSLSRLSGVLKFCFLSSVGLLLFTWTLFSIVLCSRRGSGRSVWSSPSSFPFLKGNAHPHFVFGYSSNSCFLYFA